MRPVPTLYGPWRYEKAKTQFPYDDTPTYRLAADFLNGHGLVEDWGAGVGWMGQFIDPGPYRAIDGAWSQWVDQVVDLRTYTSDVPCAFMRHVLEHNTDWRQIAQNFTDSWHDRAALVLFIPPQPGDIDLGEPDWPVPDLGISGPDLMEILEQHGTLIEVQDLVYPPENSIQWSYECLLLMQR